MIKLQHYTKQTTKTLQQQRNNTIKETIQQNNKKSNKINAVSYSTVQGHPHRDEMAY